jgi:hypothetical protein
MKTGFQLRSLRVTGKAKEPAELTFGPGLNVISGASSTGKSYILQCIDFACGAGTRPKVIDESVGYETVELELQDTSGNRHKLERSLKGGDARHFVSDGTGWKAAHDPTLSAKHSATDPETISGFLLQLSSLWGNKVRTNSAGNLISLSFRDVAHLVFVDEKRIIEDRSPLFSGQNTLETKEASVFNLFLTGVDDRSVIAHETRKDSQQRKKAQLELLDRMIGRTEEQLSNADKELTTVTDRKKRVDEAIATRTEVITLNQNEIASQQQLRQSAWNTVQQVSARRNATQQLKSRFNMLEQHYNNDLARLKAIIETDHYFSQLREIRCPLCGAAVEDHDSNFHPFDESGDLKSLRVACKEEARKIQALLRDLLGTTSQLDGELSSLEKQHQEQLSLFQDASAVIERELTPRAKQLQNELTEYMERRDALAYVEILQERLQALKQERDEIAKAVWKTQPVEDDGRQELLVPQAIENFTLAVQAVLREWRYPNLTRVTFNNERSDLIISGKDRASEGKGFRAIACSAFIIGLLRYCADRDMPHAGLVALDSPLVTYKRRDTQPGEEIPEDVGKAFYEALALTPSDRQVIVLENEDPPESVQSTIQYTHFSRQVGVGRYGFFPVLAGGGQQTPGNGTSS